MWVGGWSERVGVLSVLLAATHIENKNEEGGGLNTGLRVAAPWLPSALRAKGATERRRTERAGVQDVRQRVFQIHKVSRLKWMRRGVSDTCLNFAAYQAPAASLRALCEMPQSTSIPRDRR